MIALCVLLAVIAMKIASFMRPDADVAVAPATESTGSVPGADWQQEMALLGLATTSDPNATSTGDPLALIGPALTGQLIGLYTGLVQSGNASSASLQSAGEDVAENVRAILTYRTYSQGDLTIVDDTSFDRMLVYRSDMRESLAPLLENKNAELELYGAYVETGDPKILEEMKAAAANYRLAASKSAKVPVPRDAAVQHVGILNAMQEFAAALDGLATHAEDPLTALALLRSYTEAETNMYTTFNTLSTYYATKQP